MYQARDETLNSKCPTPGTVFRKRKVNFHIVLYISTKVTVVSLIRTSVSVRLVNRNSSLHTIRFMVGFFSTTLDSLGDNFGGGSIEDDEAVEEAGDIALLGWPPETDETPPDEAWPPSDEALGSSSFSKPGVECILMTNGATTRRGCCWWWVEDSASDEVAAGWLGRRLGLDFSVREAEDCSLAVEIRDFLAAIFDGVGGALRFGGVGFLTSWKIILHRLGL